MAGLGAMAGLAPLDPPLHKIYQTFGFHVETAGAVYGSAFPIHTYIHTYRGHKGRIRKRTNPSRHSRKVSHTDTLECDVTFLLSSCRLLSLRWFGGVMVRTSVGLAIYRLWVPVAVLGSSPPHFL